jgi:hypothetical protein
MSIPSPGAMEVVIRARKNGANDESFAPRTY